MKKHCLPLLIIPLLLGTACHSTRVDDHSYSYFYQHHAPFEGRPAQMGDANSNLSRSSHDPVKPEEALGLIDDPIVGSLSGIKERSVAQKSVPTYNFYFGSSQTLGVEERDMPRR